MVLSARLDAPFGLKLMPLYHYLSKCEVFKKKPAPWNYFYWNKPQSQLGCKLVIAPQVNLSTKQSLVRRSFCLKSKLMSNLSALNHFRHIYKCGPVCMQIIKWYRIETFVAATWRSWLVICLSHGRRKRNFLVISLSRGNIYNLSDFRKTWPHYYTCKINLTS